MNDVNFVGTTPTRQLTGNVLIIVVYDDTKLCVGLWGESRKNEKTSRNAFAKCDATWTQRKPAKGHFQLKGKGCKQRIAAVEWFRGWQGSLPVYRPGWLARPRDSRRSSRDHEDDENRQDQQIFRDLHQMRHTGQPRLSFTYGYHPEIM